MLLHPETLSNNNASVNLMNTGMINGSRDYYVSYANSNLMFDKYGIAVNPS